MCSNRKNIIEYNFITKHKITDNFYDHHAEGFLNEPIDLHKTEHVIK